MTSRGELRVLRDGGVAVVVEPDQIADSMCNRLSLGLVAPTVDGARAIILTQYNIRLGEHVVFAIQEEALGYQLSGRLFFVSYVLVDGVWKQAGNVVEDPLGNTKQEIRAGRYEIKTVHHHYLRCCG